MRRLAGRHLNRNHSGRRHHFGRIRQGEQVAVTGQILPLLVYIGIRITRVDDVFFMGFEIIYSKAVINNIGVLDGLQGLEFALLPGLIFGFNKFLREGLQVNGIFTGYQR